MQQFGATIALVDRMTAPIKSISNSMNVMINTMVEVQSTGTMAFDDKHLRTMQQSAQELGASVVQLEDDMADAANRQGQFNREVNKGVKETSALHGNLLRLASAYLSMKTLQGVINLSDTVAQTQSRLAMIVDVEESQSAENALADFEQKIMDSAMRSRAPYLQTADVIAKMGAQAGHAFDSNDELIAFTDTLNKTFVVAGNNAQATESVVYNLTQAMASGVLRGQDLNAVLSNTPQIAQAIADYLDVDISKIRELAEQGALTADVVKEAMLAAGEEINQAFEDMPLTFRQVADMAGNEILMAFEPVLEKISEMANSEWLQNLVSFAVFGAELIATAADFLIDKINEVGAWVEQNLDIVVGVLSVVAGYFFIVAAQAVLSAAMTIAAWALANLPFLLIIGVVIGVITVLRKMGKTAGEIAGGIGSIFGTLYAFIANSIVIPLWNLFATFVNFFGNMFIDPVAAIKVLLLDLFVWILDQVINLVKTVETLLNKIPFLQLDITSGIEGFRDNIQGITDNIKNESEWEELVAHKTMIDHTEAAGRGAQIGKGIVDNLSGLGENLYGGFDSDLLQGDAASALGSDVGDISKNTGRIADSVATSEEDLEHLLDLAEREVINRFTTAEVNVNFGDVNNTVNNETDLDGIMDYMTRETRDAMYVMAEGVNY